MIWYLGAVMLWWVGGREGETTYRCSLIGSEFMTTTRSVANDQEQWCLKTGFSFYLVRGKKEDKASTSLILIMIMMLLFLPASSQRSSHNTNKHQHR